MSDPVKILTTPTRLTPLGLRFWDPVSQQLIGDGLEVIAYPRDGPGQPVTAYANRAAVYVLRDLPGLREAESGTGDADFWAAAPAQRQFTIVVKDQERRFLPFQFRADAPTKGVMRWPCPLSSPPGAPPEMRATAALFSAPTRSTPTGMAVIRAQLRTPTGVPAAWAMLEAQVNGERTARGLADSKGTIALFFAFPRLPTTGSRPPLPQQTWTVQLRARYGPIELVHDAPDLCALLDQPAARLWADAQQTQPLTSATLTFGRELVLKTKQDATTWLSDVRITPT